MSERRRAATTAALGLAVAFAVDTARAADDPQKPPPKRELPNYDGRGEPPTTFGDDMLWVPRILLSPLYLVSEFVIRRPLGLLISTAERNNWAPALVQFFTFGDDHKAGLVPTAFFEFNFEPSVGLYFFWDDFLHKNNDLRVHSQIGGFDWLSLGALDRVKVGKDSWLGFEADYLRRPDYVFHGIGPRSLEDNRSRFTMVNVDVGPVYDLVPTPGVRFRAHVGVKTASIGDGEFDDDPTLSVESRRGKFPLPPGFGTGYTSVYEHAELSLDSRRPRPAPASGLRMAGHIDHGTDLRSEPGAAWVRYGGAVGGFWDVGHSSRVLGLVVNAEFEHAIRGTTPFTELVLLGGGTGGFAGYRPGRLVGQSAATAALYYEWPIWVWLDGTIHLGVGNVFDAGLRDFEAKLLRLTSGLGIRSTSSPDHQITLEIGFGTETIQDGLDVTSFRIAFGGTNGF